MYVLYCKVCVSVNFSFKIKTFFVENAVYASSHCRLWKKLAVCPLRFVFELHWNLMDIITLANLKKVKACWMSISCVCKEI